MYGTRAAATTPAIRQAYPPTPIRSRTFLSRLAPKKSPCLNQLLDARWDVCNGSWKSKKLINVVKYRLRPP